MKKIHILMLFFVLSVSAVYADSSETAVVRFVNRKVQVHRDGGAVILKMGDRLSLNEKVSIEENGKLEIEYKGGTYATKKGGTVSEIISGSPSEGTSGFKDSTAAAPVGVRALDGKRKSAEGGVLNRAVSIFAE